MKIKDQLFRTGNIQRHPDFEPYLVFNDKPGSPTIYFKSTYNEMYLPRKMHAVNPHEYYYPEKKENKIIIVKQGGHARIPHAFYTVHTTDNSPATYSVRSEDRI